MKITKQLFPNYNIVRHTSYGREVDYAQVGLITISETDIAALLNGEILGDIRCSWRYSYFDKISAQ